MLREQRKRENEGAEMLETLTIITANPESSTTNYENHTNL
jgi:hypothetical protein